MSFFDAINIDNEKDYNELDTKTMLVDVPTGWSSICLDDTITYYTECNLSLAKNKINLDLD